MFRGGTLATLLILTTLGAVLSVATDAKAAARKPNIIVIVADDLGYGEITCDGKQPIPTPRTASIAQGGVCFSSAYVTCPVCSPTRAGLLTGRYQQRFGHEFNPGPAQQADEKFGLPLSEITLADRLKKLGYATGMVGKWHLGYRRPFHPLRRGFDEFFGFLGGAHSYVDSGADAGNKILRGEKAVDEPDYLTDAFGREAVAYIDRHKQEPFFLYLTFNAVHAPLQTPDKYLSRFADIKDEKRRTFAAMLSAMDDNIGKVLDKLKQEKLEDDTLIFFIADNGGPTAQTTSRNDPLHGFKAQVWEGGIRVPSAIQWKGHIPAGKKYDAAVSSLDIVPTALAAAGGSPGSEHPLDGVDLVPYVSGANDKSPHDKLYWRFGPQWAIRSGDFKLLQPPQGSMQLFDLAQDIGEKRDLTAEKPDVVKQLKADYEQWNAQLESPRWQPQRANPAAQANRARRAARQQKQ
jgi:arylsulfatase A-like enzyme